MASVGLAEWELIGAALLAGSFLGVLIERLPDRVPLGLRRSRCGQCDTVLGMRDLVPLASWLAAAGRCRHCGAWIGWFYPGVELAALAIAAVALAVDRGVYAWVDALFGWWLLALGWIDWRRLVLPDALTLPLILLGLAEAWALAWAELPDRIAGAAVGYLALWALAWLYRRMRGREGLGMGDAKLLSAAGSWVGVSGLPTVVAGGALAALAAAGAMMLAGARLGGPKLDRHSALPFGPFLALATWLVWLFGPLGW